MVSGTLFGIQNLFNYEGYYKRANVEMFVT